MPHGYYMAPENAWIYFIQVGTGPTQIELLLPQDTSTGMGRWLHKHGPSVHHLAYMVDDVEEHARELVGKGLARIDLGPNADAAFFYPRTTMGILTELVDARTINRLHSGASSPTKIGPAEAAAALADFRASRDLARRSTTVTATRVMRTANAITTTAITTTAITTTAITTTAITTTANTITAITRRRVPKATQRVGRRRIRIRTPTRIHTATDVPAPSDARPRVGPAPRWMRRATCTA